MTASNKKSTLTVIKVDFFLRKFDGRKFYAATQVLLACFDTTVLANFTKLPSIARVDQAIAAAGIELLASALLTLRAGA
jgi:tellurite resistance protein